MNVVFIGNFLYPEGLAETKRVQYFIDAVVSEAGNTAHVLLLRQGHPGSDESRLHGRYRGVPYETIGHLIRPGASTIREVLRYLWRGMSMLHKARRSGARNVVYLYCEPNIENVAFVVAARLLGYAVVIDVVEDAYLPGDAASFGSRLKAWTARFSARRLHWFADAVIVISMYLQEKFEAIGGGRFPVQLVPVSVDLARVPRTERSFHDPVRILYAGSFAEKDGVENLISAFERIANGRPDVELLMTGRGMPDRMEVLRQRIARSPVSARMRYLGFLSDHDYFDMLSRCDIFCVVRVASDYAARGFPFKLGEFLAAGGPVIAADIGDVGSYLAHGVNALLVEPGSADGIAEALEYLLADPERARAIGRAGRAVAERNFSAVANGAQLLTLIGRL